MAVLSVFTAQALKYMNHECGKEAFFWVALGYNAKTDECTN